MLDNKVQIRFISAKSEDVPFLLQLRQKTMNEHLSLAGFQTDENYHLARIHEAYKESLIIHLDDMKIGLIKLSKRPDKLHIRQLQILPEFQNKGVGGKVLSVVIQKSKDLILPITLSVLLKNPAKKLYLKHGFKVVGENNLEYKMQYTPSKEMH